MSDYDYSEELPEGEMAFFFYGTLMQGMVNHPAFCAGARAIVPARVQGRLAHLSGGYPALLDGEEWVYGELMVFASDPVRLEALDRLEDYDPEDEENSLYQRRLEVVETLEPEREIEAFVYRMTEETLTAMVGAEPIEESSWQEYLETHHPEMLKSPDPDQT